MNLQDLIDLYRQRSDDDAGFFHVQDEVLAKFASEAEREACVRADLIFDDSTPELTTIDVVASVHTYELSPLVQKILAATFTPAGATRGQELDLTGFDALQEHGNWQERMSSRPCSLVHIDTPPSVRIWPNPSGAGKVQLQVYRLPLFDLEDLDDDLEIPVVHHDGLVSWMLYRAYSSKDSEMEDPSRAAACLDEFEARFGLRPAAGTLRRHRERRRIVTRYGGL